MSGKHFTLEDRINILMHVKQNHSMRMIATALNASASTVSRELKKHRILDEYSSFHSITPTCNRIMKAPWICNGCPRFSACRKRKYRYIPAQAHSTYESTLHLSREKIRTGEKGLRFLDNLVMPLIRDQRQTVAHVFSTHGEQMGISRSTFYRYVNDNKLTIRNIDLPKRVRYPLSKKNIKRGNNTTIDNQSCRVGRDYTAFQEFIAQHPKANIAEMDSVIGKKGVGEKVLLTLLLRKSKFMFAFLRNRNTQASVTEVFDHIQRKIGFARFATMFRVVLTDNGPEFKDPISLERGTRNVQRCHIFYCDSRASQQKGRIEKNHEYIRKYLPQGTSFNSLTQEKVNLMMSHINSVKRDSSDGRSPFECLTRAELKTIKKLGLTPIEPDEVNLSLDLIQ